MNIGKKLKQFRKQAGLTLVQLSERSGVQVATISRIENEKMTGTLESHIAMANVLNIDLTDLYENEQSALRDIEVESPESATDMFVHSDKTAYEILTKNLLQKKMMPTLIRIEPDGRTQTEQGPRGSERFVFVLEGTLTIHIANNNYVLKKNNSLYFDASLAHHIVNEGKKLARALSITTPVTL